MDDYLSYFIKFFDFAIIAFAVFSYLNLKQGTELLQKSRFRMKAKDFQIEFLWGLLDDISTAGDQYKPENNGYFKAVNQLCERRGTVANSFDGQTLTIKEIDHSELKPTKETSDER